MRYLLFAVAAVVIFTVFVTVFAASADAKSMRVLPKSIWILLCLLVTPIGGLLYLTVGRPIPTDSFSSGSNFKTKAPDDDPEFLRELKRKLRKEDNE
jgi:hypothetical protein